MITIDFETYYSKKYKLGKLTTEEYIRGDMFEVVGVAVKSSSSQPQWFSGTHEQTKEFLHSFTWDETLLAHNTRFDGAILNWVFGIKPKRFVDTMLLSSYVFGTNVSHSLANLSLRLGIGKKGTEVEDALGKHREDFTDEELEAYSGYCINDVNLTYSAWHKMVKMLEGDKGMRFEINLMDLTLKMFIDPVLEFDVDLLKGHSTNLKEKKKQLLEKVGVDKEDLMSNPKFAELLKENGVTPPTKISKTTGKETLAFAKSDTEFMDLQNHANPKIVDLMSARLGFKSTLEETRTDRFIDMAKRDSKVPISLKYFAAHTGRWGGDDKVNFQNLPSRSSNVIKKSIIAPDGHVVIDVDSSQIEARVLAWLSGQKDLVRQFKNKEDVYKIMASRIYNKSVDDVTSEERFLGKTIILGCGYGMGYARFQQQVMQSGTNISEDESKRLIEVYRSTYPKIQQYWYSYGSALESLESDGVYTNVVNLGNGVIHMDYGCNGFRLPTGLRIRYPELSEYMPLHDDNKFPNKKNLRYMTMKGWERIYGARAVENVTQAFARCVIGHQMLRISLRYKVAMTVHDSIVCVVPEKKSLEAQEYIESCMRTSPEWAEGLPLDCESKIGKSYG